MLLSKKLWNSIGLLNELLSQQNNLLSIDESKRLARSLNQCIPPDGVYAIGRENSAAVWWTHSADGDLCTTWEIHRYRQMSHIKKDCSDLNRAMTSALSVPMGSGYIASLLGHGVAKLGAWQVHYCNLAGRNHHITRAVHKTGYSWEKKRRRGSDIHTL